MSISAADMKPGESGTVVSVNTGPGRKRQLDSMGLRPGASITRKSGQPFGGPVTLLVGKTELALGRGIARQIVVET